MVDDASRLANVYGVYPAGLLELGRYANALDAMSWSRLGVRRSIISLENLAGMYLKQPLQKDQAVTDWGKSDLSYLQKLCTPPSYSCLTGRRRERLLCIMEDLPSSRCYEKRRRRGTSPLGRLPGCNEEER